MPPRISAFPKCYINDIGPGGKMSFREWIEKARALDVEGLEMYHTFPDSHEPDYLRRMREAAEQAGMCIPMYCCSPDLVHPDADVRAREMDYQRRNIKAAAVLGCGTCRILSGQRHPSVDVEQGIEWVISAITDLLPLARELGVKLAMENHYKDGAWQYPEFAQRKDVFMRILRAVEDDDFGVQFDPSNAVVAGDDPVEFLECVKDRVISMHASDRHLLPGHTLEELKAYEGNLGYSPILVHGVTGEGLNDYDRIFAILAEVGYDGWISIEDGENGMDELKRSADFLKDMRRKYYCENKGVE